MEPFGLFQILQSFLNQSSENAPQTPSSCAPQTEKNSPPPSLPNEQADTKTEYDVQPDASSQAFLSFMQAHETRAKRIKKS